MSLYPLNFKQVENPELGLERHTALDGSMQVYMCSDGTWRVYFEFGHRTSECDDKIRNLPSKEVAFEKAKEWYDEYCEEG